MTWIFIALTFGTVILSLRERDLALAEIQRAKAALELAGDLSLSDRHYAQFKRRWRRGMRINLIGIGFAVTGFAFALVDAWRVFA